GQIPDALLAVPPDDRNLAARGEDLEHQAHLPLAPPAVVLATVARRVLDLAGEEGPVFAEFLQHVAAERRALLQPGDQAAIVRPVAAAHERLEDGQVLARVEVCVPLDELPLLPEQTVELRRVEAAETAPEDQVLRRRDDRDRVELEEPEMADGLEHPPRAAVEALGPNGDPPRLLDRNLTHTGPPRARAPVRAASPPVRASHPRSRAHAAQGGSAARAAGPRSGRP